MHKHEQVLEILDKVRTEKLDFWEAFGLDHKVFFTSDLHLNHRNAISLCVRPFADEKEMNDVLIDNINKVVGVNDELFILGDFTAYGIKKGDVTNFRKRINCKFVYLIRGNHDHDYSQNHIFQKHVDYWRILDSFGKIILFHFPIASWDGKHNYSLHLHGHMHSKAQYNKDNIENGILRFDVGVDANDYKPVSLKTALDWWEQAFRNIPPKKEHHTLAEINDKDFTGIPEDDGSFV